MHCKVLKELADIVTRPLSMIFSESWWSDEVPGDWKKGSVMPIFKGRKSNPGYYLLVSLSSVPGKTMEQILLKAMLRHMEEREAFDMYPHNFLLSKLERYGFDKWTIRWMKSWLQDHTQRIVVRESLSRWISVMSGFPQGSTLGLFNIFTSDIDRIMCNNVMCNNYYKKECY